MNSLLLIEDNYILAKELSDFLTENGFSVMHASSGAHAIRLFTQNTYDICLLDIGLPDCSGFHLCQQMRQQSLTPIIMLTAYDEEDDIIRGLESGADDYVTKPCSLRVLLSRLASHLRRKDWFESQELHTLKSGELLIDFEHCMISRHKTPLAISDIEFKLCAALVRNDGRIMPRNLLLDKIWDANERFIEDNTLSVHISRLRKKIGSYNGEPYIETIKGIGYRWTIPVTKN